MEIKYIIISDRKEIDDLTFESISACTTPEHVITAFYGMENEPKSREESLNQIFDSMEEKENSYVCIIPNGGTIIPHYQSLMEVYNANTTQDELLLPMIQLIDYDESKEIDFRGILHSCVWIPYLAGNYGFLDLNLAIQQIDVTLYGALIPSKIVKQFKLKTELKYFSFFEFYNNLSANEIVIKGVPKLIGSCFIDSDIKEASNQEKTDLFELAKEGYQDKADKATANRRMASVAK
jgi:hypothetical protein